ncbi:STAS domain-containing protein [Catellatospora methionotrophica]|uniref:STAS domain-containing protein n=1 Tax=Catellatospora methionotrophica TaxID=121620 RepID=UPI0033FD65B8
MHGDDPREAVVAVSGEIDLAVREDLLNTLHHAIHAIHATAATAVVVDLSRVTFMDSTGLHVLLTSHKSALGSGVGFSVVGATGLVHRLLAVTGMLGLLTGETDTGEHADADLSPPADRRSAAARRRSGPPAGDV